MMRLAEWDEKIAPHLRGIEAGASMCARHVRQLVYQPEFATLAADEMEKLEGMLGIVLERLRQARREFHGKPVDD